MDANYFSPSESGRGISIDYVPNDDGSGLLFGAVFSFEDSGDNAWITFSGQVLEHQFEAETDIFLTTGGSFGFPFPGVSNTQIGTATVTANSCTSITVAFDFNEGIDLDVSDVTLEDLQPAVTNPQCAYTEEFDGCPSFATEIGTLDRACLLNGKYENQDLLLTNDTTWVFSGLVEIGGSDPAGGSDNVNPSTITIEPGTVLIGAGESADFLYVNPGSKIFAEGTPSAPIVWTSPFDGFRPGEFPDAGDVGGVVLAGNAQCNAVAQGNRCQSEFRTDLLYGRGEDPLNNESSGVIRYFQVRYAGIEFVQDREVNAFTFQGVGRGTVVDHIQAHRGADDGVEFFGGTVNVKYAVFSSGEDDGIDWDTGWAGKLQYGLVTYNGAFGGDHGIEGAGNPDNFDAQPRTQPVLSNITFIGDASDAENGSGIRIKEGSAGQVWNSVVTGFNNACLEFQDLPTYTAAGTPAAPSGITAFAGTLLSSGGCPVVFKDEDGAPYSVEDFFSSSAFPGNAVVGNLMLDGFQPMPGSPALGNGVQVFDLGDGETEEFFDTTPYSGAFNGSSDWTQGWTIDIFGEAAASIGQ
ncbi:MAG: hypothetical protein U5L08_05210 [Xanthomonadales bacterium]|nr:hypothetical protein [Xanthomonadales bacterium]